MTAEPRPGRPPLLTAAYVHAVIERERLTHWLASRAGDLTTAREAYRFVARMEPKLALCRKHEREASVVSQP